MKIKFVNYVILLGVLLFISCKKEDANLYPEEILEYNFIGTWRINYSHDYEILEIKSNHSFVKTNYWIYDNGEEQIFEIVEGNYKIKDGQFKINNAEMTYFSDFENNETIEKATYLYPIYNINHFNNTLELLPVNEFEPLEDNISGTIFGKWKSESKILLIYSILYEEKYLIGNYTELIELPTNTSDYYYQGILEYGNTVFPADTFRYTYSFENNVFSVNEFTFNANVSFHEEKMLWELDPIIYFKQ
ncbi:MAG: hypothetical protein K8R49_07530 [Candidatus Cloacimonetes bacterium]|nr:hypothetical protein [Candidatus Cloacimonadota bacterium]